jgi:hypothetical protein
VETSKFCLNDGEDIPRITSHPSGPVAIVREGRNIIDIKGNFLCSPSENVLEFDQV